MLTHSAFQARAASWLQSNNGRGGQVRLGHSAFSDQGECPAAEHQREGGQVRPAHSTFSDQARHDAHTARHTRRSPPSSPTRHITLHTVGV